MTSRSSYQQRKIIRVQTAAFFQEGVFFWIYQRTAAVSERG
jgi:F0F1-type ATP synthase assembly protein I